MTWTTKIVEEAKQEFEELKDASIISSDLLESSHKNNSEVMANLALNIAEGKKKLRSKITKPDLVNSPPHYTAGGIETIDYIKAKLTPEEFIGYLKGNVIKYTSRAGKKNDMLEDLEKAQWYMNRQIKELKGESK